MSKKTQSISIRQGNIAWAAAHAAVGAAAQAALELGVCVNIAVVDRHGQLTAFVRMNDAPMHSIEIAIDKAYTAAAFGLPTGQWHEALQAHSPAVREGIVLRPRFVSFGGGFPIACGEERIGGIGVSGGSEEQDEIIARAGLATLEQEENFPL